MGRLIARGWVLAAVVGCAPTDPGESPSEDMQTLYQDAYCERLAVCEPEIVAFYEQTYGLEYQAALDRFYADQDSLCGGVSYVQSFACNTDEATTAICLDAVESFDCLRLLENELPYECDYACPNEG